MKRDTKPSNDVQLIRRETPFRGRLVTVRVDRILLPGGEEAVREVVLHPGAVAIVACPRPGAALLVRQYRHPAEASLWEIPAGKLEPGEDALTCAKRELEEETGYRAMRWKKLVTVYTTPGFTNERISLWRATGLQRIRDAEDRDVTGCIAVASVELERMIRRDEILDAKSLLGLLWTGLITDMEGTVDDETPRTPAE